jgi:hypothetical protein
MTMIEEKIARVKTLIQKREEIDAELATLFGMTEQAKRGRPRKEPGNGAGVHVEQKPAPEAAEQGTSGSDGA